MQWAWSAHPCAHLSESSQWCFSTSHRWQCQWDWLNLVGGNPPPGTHWHGLEACTEGTKATKESPMDILSKVNYRASTLYGSWGWRWCGVWCIPCNHYRGLRGSQGVPYWLSELTCRDIHHVGLCWWSCHAKVATGAGVAGAATGGGSTGYGGAGIPRGVGGHYRGCGESSAAGDTEWGSWSGSIP